jgi:hypothetical protein
MLALLTDLFRLKTSIIGGHARPGTKMKELRSVDNLSFKARGKEPLKPQLKDNNL